MPTNDFLPFAINTDAGVMSQADYAARAGLGVEPGLADPDFANKAWRQSSVMAAMLGRVIAGEGLNALDNGEVDALKNNFLDALAARVLLKMQAINNAGGLEYRTDHDYVPGSIVLQSGIKYICLTSNGPSSTVKSPASDTTKTYWAAVVSMADVSSTGGAGKIPIATNEGYLKAATPSSNDVSENVATTAFINQRLNLVYKRLGENYLMNEADFDIIGSYYHISSLSTAIANNYPATDNVGDYMCICFGYPRFKSLLAISPRSTKIFIGKFWSNEFNGWTIIS